MHTPGLRETSFSTTQSSEALNQTNADENKSVSKHIVSASKEALAEYKRKGGYESSGILSTGLQNWVAQDSLEALKNAIYNNSEPKTWPTDLLSFEQTCCVFRDSTLQSSYSFISLAQKLHQEGTCWGGENQSKNLLEATLEILKAKALFEDELLLSCLSFLDKTCLQDKIKEANIDINVKDSVGKTLLHWAAEHGHAKVVQAFLDAGADVNTKTNDGRMPLHWAAHDGHAEVIKVLLDAGAYVNAKAHDGSTPLHIAALNGHAKVVKVLLDAGNDANAEANDGWRPLHMAAFKGYIKVAHALLAAKAQVHAKNNDGWTPLDLATLYKHSEVARLLKSAMN